MIRLFLLAFLAGCPWGHAGLTVNRPLTLAEDLNIYVRDGKILFDLPNEENGETLQGELGVKLPEDTKSFRLCEDNQDNCLQFDSGVSLTTVKKGSCYSITWNTTENVTLADCFDYGTNYWYGGPENTYQYWPFSNMTFEDSSYITKEDGNQGVAEPYWVTSSAYYVYVDKSTPLFIDSKNIYSNGLCLIAKQEDPYLSRGSTVLKYKICKYKNMRKAHTAAIKNDLGKPSALPDSRMVEHPIWSTWVRFKYLVNQTAVLQFAKDIVSYGFNNSQLEIDDNWETCYGSAQFNKSRFPSMPTLGKQLDNLGFRITLWNHPFVNTNCDLFKTLEAKGYFVKDQEGNVVSVWWDGNAGVIDFTNPDAAAWYVNRRKTMMKKNKIDGLKLDAGESSWLPQIPSLTGDSTDQPNLYTTAYVNTGSEFGNIVEVRAGHHSQNLSIFVRMLDKDSKWTFDNGLPTLITTLLQMNLNGYAYVLPDMVGGNAYNEDVVTKELFIRWLQANTFMPSVQFSAAPWDFDNETITISKKFTELHYSYAATILSVMQKCVNTGAPVNMPIWWAAPRDKTAHAIWDEYMLGDDILVAPVVVKGAVTRDIYLPRGQWRDEADSAHTVYKGPKWLRDYSAPLDTLPFFTKVTSATLDEDEDED